MPELRLQISECHWCEETISRSAPQFKWFDMAGTADCSFHPIAWNEEQFQSTGVTAPHMTTLEVHDAIREHSVRQLNLTRQARRPITDNVISVARRAQRTSRKAAEKLQPSAGTIRASVWQAIKDNQGMTDYELETLLRGKHQTISASRRSLVVDGWIVDSGTTRKNPQGNDCIVWVLRNPHEVCCDA